MDDRNKSEERNDLPPEKVDGPQGEPETSEPNANRRGFLVNLGTMSFLTAAVVKLGVTPRADALPAPGDGTCKAKTVTTDDGTVLDIDPYCGKPSLSGEPYASPDLDCGKEKSNGDQDCGKTAPSGNTWSDEDCVVSGGDGADNDCGKSSSGGWAWEDNDCSKGGEDQDCGKTNSQGDKHTDSDGS